MYLVLLFLPRGAMGWSVICDGGLSWSFFFLGACHIWVVKAFYSDMDVNTGMKLGFWLICKGPHLGSLGFAKNKGADPPAQADQRLCCSLIEKYHI